MANVEFFKQQSKNFLKDYKTRVFNEDEGFYDYSPRYFQDIDELLYDFGFREDDSFSLMNAQHIVASLAGFHKWNDLIKASEPMLEIGKLLLMNRAAYQEREGGHIVDDWQWYQFKHLKSFDDNSKLEIFKMVFFNINFES